VDLAGIQWTKWTEKTLFDGPQGYVAGASEAFRTVSLGTWENSDSQVYQWGCLLLFLENAVLVS
jgi:hypothetical protein